MSLARFSVRNPIAVNLFMWAVIVGGLYAGSQLIREFFPSFEPDQVLVTVPYPGASPEEIEKSVTRRIEEELRDLEGVEEVASQVLEGVTVIQVTIDDVADRARVLDELRSRIDRVETELPAGAEDVEIFELRPFVPVIAVTIYGDVAEERLRAAALEVRDELLELPGVSQITVSGVRDRELIVEVRPEDLERWGLTFEEVGRVVAGSNLDLPGGRLESPTGNVGVRTMGETSEARILERLVLRSDADGRAVTLAEVANVRDGYEDKIETGRFAGRSAVAITVFKAPEQDALEISRRVKDYVAANPTRLGGAVALATRVDLARFIEQRLDLLTRNALIGLALVALVLATFLDLRVAFWVAVGLPVSFFGTFLVMAFFGLTINLISMFALITVLGLIVDDAIVIGENVFAKIRAGVPLARAAIDGTNEVARPIMAAILTTIGAFVPLLFVGGQMGKFLAVLPQVVIAALLVSMVEAFVVLPCHLATRHRGRGAAVLPFVGRFAKRASEVRHRVFEEWMPRHLETALRFVIRWRYAVSGVLLGAVILTAGLVAGGLVPFVFIQTEDAESVLVNLEMAAGTPQAVTDATLGEIEALALAYDEVSSVYAVVGTSFGERGQEQAADPATVGQLAIELHPADEREARGQRTSTDIVNEMRRATASLPGVTSLTYVEQGGGPSGADVEVRVRSKDLETLRDAVDHVRRTMEGYPAITEIDDDFRIGKLEARLRLNDGARSLGLTTRDLALQVRHALFGFEAQELQVGNEEMKVRVMLPPAARRTLSDLRRLRLVTPSGGRVPIEEVASIETERGFASIARVDGRRAVSIKAEVDEEQQNVADLTARLAAELADLPARFPGAAFSFEGRQKETRDSFASLRVGYPASLLLIYAMIAILFRSYTQPVIVMSAIPTAVIGAVVGHWITGYPLTLLSLIGIVALSGIVVNDSLILVDKINRVRRRTGASLLDAVVEGARSRMRPILLTSITTIAGLAPLMLETSFQAKFLIPMAVSIVFGLALSTVTTLLAMPTLYVLYEDGRAAVGWLWTGTWRVRTLERRPEIPDVSTGAPQRPQD